LVTRNTQVGPINFSVIKRFKGLFEKPYAVLADMLAVSERTAKRKLAGERDLSGEELERLIRSEQGFEIVAAIMADCSRPPKWWRICAPVMEAAEIREMQMIAQRRITKAIEGALDADKQLSATLRYSEALSVHDEDHMRPHVDALRAVSRAPDRALAPSARGRK